MNLLEALEVHGIPYRTQRKPGEINICCPFCVEEGAEEDTEFKLGINVHTGFMHCFHSKCSKSSRDMEYTLSELVRALALDVTPDPNAKSTVKKQEETAPVELPKDFRILKMKAWGGDEDDFWTHKAAKYLHRRGVTADQVKHKKIGVSFVGYYAYRLVIPVWWHGKLRGIVARALKDSMAPKYKNSTGEKYIYNLSDETECVVLVEGAFDALAVERGCSPKYRVDPKFRKVDSSAVLGHTLTERQLKQLKNYRRFYLWFDPDKAGVEGTIEVAHQLRHEGWSDVWAVMPNMNGEENYDPSEYQPREIMERIKKKSEEFTPEVELKLKNWLAFNE